MGGQAWRGLRQDPEGSSGGKEFVFACVGNDADLRAVTIGPDGAFQAMKPGAIFVDKHHRVSRRSRGNCMQPPRALGIHFNRRPGFRRPGRRRKWRAHRDVRWRCRAFRQGRTGDHGLCPRLPAAGPSGSGQLAKMMNQICIAGLVQGLSEAVHFGKRAGLDIEAVLDVISRARRDPGKWRTAARR